MKWLGNLVDAIREFSKGRRRLLELAGGYAR